MVSRTEKNKSERAKIKRQETHEKTKHFIIKFLKYFITITVITTSICLYVYYVSTRQLIIREYSNKYDTLPESFNGIKILQFGDLYYDDNYGEILNEIVNKSNKLKPDLIFFTGGLINKKYNLTDSVKEKLITTLSSMNSKIDKYFVVSDNDNEETISILNKSNFKFLDDDSSLIYYKGQKPIMISGINKNSKINNSKNSNYFNIVIVNDYKMIDEIISINKPDIIMTGNNLNGQIRIPYYGALLKHNTYSNPYYNLDGIDVYVTGGIGTNNVPVRIFNHPSINFYRLRSK